MKKILRASLCAALIVFSSSSCLLAALEDDIEVYKKGVTKATVVSAAVGLGSWLGEKWAIDVATRVITKTVTTSPAFFNMLVGSTIRGHTLIKALPLAGQKGAFYGALGAGFLTPLAWECGSAVYSSAGKICETWSSANLSPEKQATKKDYISVGTTVASFGAISYMLFKY